MKRTALILSLTLTTVAARGQTSYPMISRVEPTAIQRGKTVELAIAGDGDFSGASGLLAEGSGLTGEIVPAKAAEPTPDKAKAARDGGREAARRRSTCLPRRTPRPASGRSASRRYRASPQSA